MRHSLAAGAIAVAARLAGVHAVDFVGGNYYGNEVTHIQITNVGGSSSYDKTTSMDPGTGAFTSEPFAYSGPMAPFDEEVCTQC